MNKGLKKLQWLEDYSPSEMKGNWVQMICRECENYYFLPEGEEPEQGCPKKWCKGTAEALVRFSAFIKKKNLK